MKYCTHCGAKLDDNAKFCSECGRKTGGNGGWNNKKTGIVIGIVAAVIAVALIFFFVGKGNSSDKISLEKPLELTKENLAGTWEMKDGKDKTTIVFTDKAVTVDSSKLENSKELKDGTYEISKDTIKLTFKPKKDKVVVIETNAGVNKDSLQLITQDKDYKALNGIYTKAAEKKETAKEQKKEESASEDAETTAFKNFIADSSPESYGYFYEPYFKENVLIAKYGTCEADYKINFYSYDKENGKVRLWATMGGGHTGIFSYNGRMYALWAHQGTQTLSKVYMNGDFVYPEDGVQVEQIASVSAGPHNGLRPDQINVLNDAGIPEDQVSWIVK